ncbi:MAG: hypothetical protein QME57_02880 [Patescibacteria group bacterium]|nr:hypothetical protein [Patescibacteria group bacterium]
MKFGKACLLGIKCRYDGESKFSKKVIKLAEKEGLISVCPPYKKCQIFRAGYFFRLACWQGRA